MSILENKKIVISVFISLSILTITGFIFSYYFYSNKNVQDINNETLAISNIEEEQTKEIEKTNYYVEVKGAVVNPGVYQVASDNIINDIITLAGGFTKNAYTNNINLSHRVSNELVIYVYTKTEYQSMKKESEVVNTKTEVCNCDTYVIDSCVESSVSIIESTNTSLDENTTTNDNTNVIVPSTSESVNINAASDTKNNLININTANVSLLTTLSGIGEAKANEIIKYREENGSFKTIEEIKNVSGIGDKAYEKIKDYITVQ